MNKYARKIRFRRFLRSICVIRKKIIGIGYDAAMSRSYYVYNDYSKRNVEWGLHYALCGIASQLQTERALIRDGFVRHNDSFVRPDST